MSPTWMPARWLKQADLKGKIIALFGCGDATDYSDTFCGGMAALYDAVKDKGADIIGQVAADSYTYDDSESVIDGKCVGLAIDCSESEDETQKRLNAWVDSIKSRIEAA